MCLGGIGLHTLLADEEGTVFAGPLFYSHAREEVRGVTFTPRRAILGRKELGGTGPRLQEVLTSVQSVLMYSDSDFLMPRAFA